MRGGERRPELCVNNSARIKQKQKASSRKHLGNAKNKGRGTSSLKHEENKSWPIDVGYSDYYHTQLRVNNSVWTTQKQDASNRIQTFGKHQQEEKGNKQSKTEIKRNRHPENIDNWRRGTSLREYADEPWPKNLGVLITRIRKMDELWPNNTESKRSRQGANILKTQTTRGEKHLLVNIGATRGPRTWLS